MTPERRIPGAPLALAALAALVVSLPLLAVASSVLQPSTEVLAHLMATVLPRMLANTLGLVVFVGLGTVFLGTLSAWLVVMYRFPGSRAFEWALLLPLAMPAYIIGYAYTDALTFAGPVQSWLRDVMGWSRGDYWFPDISTLPGVSLMLVLVLYPYVYILARTAFLQQSACMTDASRVLGRSPVSSFLTVALPIARPAIVAGAALALMEAMADFGTVQYFGVDTFTTAIYRAWIGMGDRLAAAQLAIGLVIVVLLLLLVERRSRAHQRYFQLSKRHLVHPPQELTGLNAALAFAACLAPVVLGFTLPGLYLVRLHILGGDPLFGPRFLGYALNSVLLAGAATIIIMAVALVLASAQRNTGSPVFRVLVRFATLGYALPGMVIAVGVLVPLAMFDNGLDALLRATVGISTGLLLSGTVAALLFAYVVRFLAVGFGAVDAGFERISRRFDDVARTLGRSETGVHRDVHVPLLRRPLLTGAVVVFVDVLKELPATLIVRPFDFDTLAVRVYQLASDERLAQASTGALMIVAIGLVPVVILTRVIRETSVQRNPGRANPRG